MDHWSKADRRPPGDVYRHPVDRRDAGLDLIRRGNRWLVAGAVGLAGVVSLAAAHAFPGRTITSGVASAVSGQAQPQQGSSGSGLQSPSQAPGVALPAPSAVVSGGS
ncbi:MAG: hypothetical protein ACLP01_04820 [Solirubrobacteraceae bacterium]